MASNRLLVIDDEPASAATIGRVARGCGYDTIITTDIDDFRSRISAWSPTVIVLDLAMPEMDGHRLMAWLAAQGCAARILIVSGKSAVELQAAETRGKELGLHVVGSLAKPLRVEPLRAAFRQIYDSAGVLSAQDVSRALEQRAIRLVYQPKVHLRSGAVTGFEALARWDHPTRGPIPPNVFIPMLEAHHIIDDFTSQIFDIAFNDLSSWRDRNDFGLAVNISAANCRRMAVDSLIRDHCLRTGILPDRITVEITETAAMSDAARTRNCLTRLHEFGANLSIDDFGTGYSSLAKLNQLPFSELKIDRSFVQQCDSNGQSGMLIRAMVDLAHNFGMKAVAEGIETEEVMRKLRNWDCDIAQGYFIAKPMPPAEVMNWMQSWTQTERRNKL